MSVDLSWGYCADCGTPYRMADLCKLLTGGFLCRWHFTLRHP